jgi:predicted amidohydrolase YtcJ
MKHNHTEGLQCSCCSPLWKTLLPDTNGMSIMTDRNLESENDSSHEELIFRTGTDENCTGSKQVGYIQTIEGGKDVMVEAIAISKGKIVATGSYKSVVAQMPPGTSERIIYGGQTLLPGFIEPHLHIIATAVFKKATDVSPFLGQDLRSNVALSEEDKYSRKWVVEELKKKVTNNKNVWIIGRNADPSLFEGSDKEFNAEVLDAISTIQPVFILNSSMHLAYINTVAITLMKVKFPEINVSPDGVLKEVAGIEPVLKLIEMSININPVDAIAKLEEEVKEIFKEASKRGVTYVQDCGIEPFEINPKGGGANFDQPSFLKRLANQENCPVRIGGALVALTLDKYNTLIQGKYQPNHGDDKFNLAYIKIIGDGSNQGLTGYQYNPYACDANYQAYDISCCHNQNNTGVFNFGYPIEFNALVSKAKENNWPVMIHANGDQAIDRTINAFKLAGINKDSIDTRRDRIEHASLLTDKNLKDMQELGLSPSFLIGHVGYWGWVFQQTIFGKEKANLLDRCQAALQNGMRITLHSDNSVTPLGPLRMMEQAITRVMEGAPKNLDPQVLNETECITRFHALKAMTYDAAWQCHADQWVGSLEVGKCADFVILSESPLTYFNKEGVNSVTGMRNIPVLETWKDGKKVMDKQEDDDHSIDHDVLQNMEKEQSVS